jgi:hypothetical protein
MSDSRVKFYTVNELLQIPEPRWLIEDIIHQQETAALWGPPNCGKSFIAIDWALCVSAGVPWLGRYKTIQSPVIYMAGEGSASLQKRVRAWIECYDVAHLDAAYFQVRPLPLREEDVIDEILTALQDFGTVENPEAGLNPGFVVIDTLSQFFGGGDENGPDMALFVSNVRRLSHEQNLSVLMVHHSNATGLRERGHTALRGNVDAMFEAKAHDKTDILAGVTLLTDKQRDSAKGRGIAVQFNPYRDSLVPSYDEERNATEMPPVRLSRAVRKLLQEFEAQESPQTESCIHIDLMADLGMTKTTFHRRLQTLKDLKLIGNAGRGKSALTFLGREVLRQEER